MDKQHGLSGVLDRNETLILNKLSMMDEIMEEALREARDHLECDIFALNSLNTLNSIIINESRQESVGL